LILTVGQEHRDPLEIDVGGGLLYAVTFSVDGEYLFSGGDDGARVWRVQDGKQVARLEAGGTVLCLAVSKDGKWIAAGTRPGDVLVWDANTYKQVCALKDGRPVNGVDFSPDSTRIVSASDSNAAVVWDIVTRERVQTFRYGEWVLAAKYSPQGNRIATAIPDSIRVYDSNDYRLLVDIKVEFIPWYGSGLRWFNDYLVVVSDGKIKQFEASTGSTVSEWPVPNTNKFSCIALPKRGRFIGCSTNRTVTFWDMATHTQLALTQHLGDIGSIALSPDDSFIAIGGRDAKIVIQSLSHIIVSTISLNCQAYHLFALVIVTRGTQSLCFVYSPRSRNQTFRSTTLRSILGSSVNSRTQKHY